MKLPLSWLKDFVEIEHKPEKLAEELLLSGTKVEETAKSGEDYVFDLEITSNRADCLSIYGLSREVSAISNKTLRDFSTNPVSGENETPGFEINISNKSLMPYFGAVVLENLEIKPSSSQIKERLQKCGIRDLLNLIDITNYVMLETGQPMHAFDYDKVSGHVLNVRESTDGEKVTPIDGVVRTLKAGSIIIEDNEKLIDLAGIMGGKNSEVSEKTKRALLLVPIYDPVRIRKTSLHLGLRTEASNRFEKLLDNEGPAKALERAVELAENDCNARAFSKPVFRLPNEAKNSIEFDLNLIPKVLGLHLTPDQVSQILKSLGFQTVYLPLSETPTLRIDIPSWRRDIENPVDILEEIGRIYGYNALPTTLPSGTPPLRTEGRDLVSVIKHTLVDWGFLEAVGYTLVGKTDIENLGLDSANLAKVKQPMSQDFEYLRPTLLTGLLNSARGNQKNGFNYPYFEIGRIFVEKFNPENLLTNQPKILAGIYPTQDFYTLKGLLEDLLNRIKFNGSLVFRDGELEFCDSFQTATVTAGDSGLGKMGKLKTSVLNTFDLEGNWFYFEFFLDKIVSFSNTAVSFKPLPKYPSVSQDISILLPQNTTIEAILNVIDSANEILLVDRQISDIYTNQSLGTGKRSVSIKLTFQSPEKTLIEDEVNGLRKSIEKLLKEKLNCELRS